jgi:hypothetical protein
MGVSETVLERKERNMLKWYRHVVRMEDNRWPERKMTWSPERRRRRGRLEIKWEQEVERVMKQRSLISDDAVSWQLWRLKTGNRWTTETLIDNLNPVVRRFSPQKITEVTSKL